MYADKSGLYLTTKVTSISPKGDKMKLKKYIIGIITGAMIAASMAVPAAAASPSTDTVKTHPSKAYSSTQSGSGVADADTLSAGISGEVIKYDGIDLDPTIPADLEALSPETIEKAKAQGAAGIIKAVDAEDSSDHNGKGTKYQDTITVRFHSKAFKAGMKITVFHLADGQDKFEKITPDSVKDGECVVTFRSLSPVIFATEGKSDKTGESVPVLPAIAVVCLLGAVYCWNKSRAAD